MPKERIEVPKEFLEDLLKNPKLMEQLQRKAEIEAFKEEYSVERATPLKCPACSGFQMSGGSLWIHKENKTTFTCRKCKLTWKVECLTKSNDEIIIQIREINKAGGNSLDAKGEVQSPDT